MVPCLRLRARRRCAPINRALLGAALTVLALSASPAEQVASVPDMLGFDASSAAAQRELEQRFDGQIKAAELQDWLRTLASEPNQVGSAHDRANAELTLRLFREWGWDANIETFSVLYPTPRRVALELTAPHRFIARLREPVVTQDASAGHSANELPPYNVYGADGDVSGELVYVNFGGPEDYQELDRRGISVQGKVVIARYGGGWRGLKPKLAHEHGAIGCIIYSDPKGDGYYVGDTYPAGGWRPADGVQRGSVADMMLYPGDPLPGNAAAPVTKSALAAAPTLIKIPVLPISYADAQPLLAALGGAVAPAAWRGALPITYHIGAGPARVHLHVESDWSRKDIYDVIARLPGRELPDEWVIRGNHHDGWVFGAWDPLAGNTALLAEAKAIGALHRSGWQPLRTLIYASWDGEEPGLLGSTAWAQQHAQELQSHAVLYLNSDTNERGFLDAGGSHSLQRLVNEVADGVRDPQTGVSVLARLRAKLRVDAFDGDHTLADKAQAAAAGTDLPLEALGSGSDFSVFLQHLGIASLDIAYIGEGADDGVYHSAYDSYDHFVRFGDPGLAYGVAEAQTAGHLALRMADAPVLPLQFVDVATTYGDYVHELHQLAEDKRAHAQQLRDLRAARAFELAADPRVPLAAPREEPSVPYLDFAPLDNAVVHLSRAARDYDRAYAAAVAGGFASLDGPRRARLNALLRGLEQTLLSEQGLPGRSWYRHMVYAPGVYTGYGAKTLPAVREALEQGEFALADSSVAPTAQALERYSAQLDAAVALLQPTGN